MSNNIFKLKNSHIINNIKKIFLLTHITNSMNLTISKLETTQTNNLIRLNIALLSFLIVTIFSGVILLIVAPNIKIIANIICLGIVLCIFRNHLINNPYAAPIRIGSHLITSFYFIGISLAIPLTGGINSPLISYYCLCPIIADFLFNNNKIIIWAISSCVGLSIQILFHMAMPLPTTPPSQTISLILITIEVFIIVLYIYFNRKLSSNYQTNLRLLNKEISDAHLETQKTVVQRTQELKIAKEKAEESNNIKTQFLANMSHELRTPMHAILSFADLAHTKITQIQETMPQISHPTSQQQQDKTNNINTLLNKALKYQINIADSASRLVLLVNDLLDLSKLQSPNIKYKFKYYTIEKAISGVSEEFKSLLKQNQTQLQVIYNKPEDQDLTIKYDFPKIKQVFCNLVANSLKFSPNNSAITITISSIPSENNKMLKIIISDEGIGVPEDEKESIFDAFIQSQKQIKIMKKNTQQQGTGLGLAICKKIIDAHHGKIWVENHTDKPGCSFCFTLPI